MCMAEEDTQQEKMNVPALGERMHPSSIFCSVWAHNKLADVCPRWRGWIYFTQSPDLNANLFQKF